MTPLKKRIAVGVCLALLAGAAGLYWYATDQETKKIAQLKALMAESKVPLPRYDSIAYSLFSDRFTIANLFIPYSPKQAQGAKIKQLVLEGVNMDMLQILDTTVVFKLLRMEGVELVGTSGTANEGVPPVTLEFFEITNGKANMAALIRGIEANRTLAFLSLAADSIEFAKLRITPSVKDQPDQNLPDQNLPSQNQPGQALSADNVLASVAATAVTGGIDHGIIKNLSAFSYGPLQLKGLSLITPDMTATVDSAGFDGFTFGLGGLYSSNLVYTLENYGYTNLTLKYGDEGILSIASVALSSQNTNDNHATSFTLTELRAKGVDGKNIFETAEGIPKELYPVLQEEGILVSLKGALKGGKRANEFTLAAQGEAEINIMGRVNGTMTLSGLLDDAVRQPLYMDVLTAYEKDLLFFETGSLMLQSNESLYILLKEQSEEAKKKLEEFKGSLTATQSTPVQNYLVGLGNLLVQPGTLHLVAAPERPVLFEELLQLMENEGAYLTQIIDLLGVHTEYTPRAASQQ